jgi:MurNAc alpha-1-phosphate uridylyltransferase
MPSTSNAPTHAMVLAAGLGVRMRPITDTLPKPLVRVAGETMLDRALNKLAAAGVERAVVNTHHLADQIADHLKGRKTPAITLSHEADVLETGGGVLRALPHLGDRPFFVVNSDSIWDDGPVPALTRLAAAWDDAAMDALLLVHPTVSAVGYGGSGDFFLDLAGKLSRRREQQVAPFLFTGLQILHPRLFAGLEPGKFSLNVVYDRALEAGRLHGLRHDGGWYHVGTPEALDQVEAIFTAPVFSLYA